MESLKLTYQVEGGNLLDAGEASSKTPPAPPPVGLPAETIRKASICMYEGEINMVIHAHGGRAEVEVYPDHADIWLKDRGPGIADIALAMKEGYSTASENIRSLGFGAGMGLPNMKKYSDEMRIDSTVGVGTTVFLRVNF